MKRPNITPGEWKILSPLNDHMVSDQSGHVLAVTTNGNEEINARAIAALPKLLEALEELLVCPDLNLGNLEEETLTAIENAKAALIEAGYTLD